MHIAPADDKDGRSVATTFIILSYLRPQNIQRILDAILQARSCERIILSNNNPDIDIRDHIDSAPERLEVVQQIEHWHPIKRFCIARETDSRFFMCIDDDLFLTPRQIDLLADRLAADPGVPHGLWGERGSLERDAAGNKWFRLESGLHNLTGEVDIINRVYAFTQQHVTRFFELIAALGVDDPRKLGRCDDVLLSFSGAGRPKCHDLGPLEECPTSSQDGIAVWRQPGFTEQRIERLVQLMKIVGPR